MTAGAAAPTSDALAPLPGVGHPPAPWRLAGPSIVVPALVPLHAARRLVPPDAAVVPVAPGLTAGGLIAVTYEEGSTLTYSELVVAAGLVRTGRAVGGWISHIWVDSEASVNGGRSIWKLPKELASFRHEEPSRRFEASSDGVTLVRIAAAPARATPPVRLPAAVPMVSGTEGSHWFTLGRSTLSSGLARVRVDIPPGSPLTALGMRPSPVGLAGHAMLLMDAARPG